jgi:acetyl esterase/lipase
VTAHTSGAAAVAAIVLRDGSNSKLTMTMRKLHRTWPLAIAFGCAALAATAAAETPAASNAEAAGQRGTAPLTDIRVYRDVAYGEAARQRFDVYAPARTEGAPVIFMVHGGAWRFGDKTHANVIENKVRRWVAAGWVFISTNYRLLPQADALEQARDVARALAAAQRMAAQWGADAHRFVLMGHSAGAHLVALVHGAPTFAAEFGAKPALGAVLLDSAALDVVALMSARHARLYDHAFGADPAFWRAASPYHALAAGAPPILAVCSTERRDDSCAQANAYADRARSLGVRASVLPQPLSHAEINWRLGLEGAYTEAVERFIASLDPALAARLKGAP